MRQADSTIKGYVYQFNKSICELLSANDDDIVTLEGVIEDIDIHSSTEITTIQCKYHEDSKYQISSVATPILEMLCHYCESSYLGKSVSYILYAYYAENVDEVDMDSFSNFLETTVDKDILCKYFHRIYTVSDSNMLTIANKQKKTKAEKEELINYYKNKRDTLSLRVSISDFWNCFTYQKAKQFAVLQEEVVNLLCNFTDEETAKSLYYPNAFSLIAALSAKHTEKERTITKKGLLSFLEGQKTLLINKWTLEALDKEKLLRTKKRHLSSLFSSNADVRTFVFTDSFLDENETEIISFIQEYLSKYFKKPRLQKPPIFIFGNDHSNLMQSALIELYKYQRSVNNGLVGNVFVEDSFINNKSCPADFVCKMSMLNNITVNILERCQVNQVFIIGTGDVSLQSVNYITEMLDVDNVNTVRYLVDLVKTLEV